MSIDIIISCYLAFLQDHVSNAIEILLTSLKDSKLHITTITLSFNNKNKVLHSRNSSMYLRIYISCCHMPYFLLSLINYAT